MPCMFSDINASLAQDVDLIVFQLDAVRLFFVSSLTTASFSVIYEGIHDSNFNLRFLIK
jgi:hypothetical protein